MYTLPSSPRTFGFQQSYSASINKTQKEVQLRLSKETEDWGMTGDDVTSQNYSCVVRNHLGQDRLDFIIGEKEQQNKIFFKNQSTMLNSL